MSSHTAARNAPSPPGSEFAQLALDPPRAGRLGTGDVRRVEHEGGCPPNSELGDAAQRVGVFGRARELRLDDRVGVAGRVLAGVPE